MSCQRLCRCFPKFPAELTNSIYSMLDTNETGVLASAASTVKSSFTSGGSFGNYVADISKGILIIVIGGLAAGMVLSLVRRHSLREAHCLLRALAAPVQRLVTLVLQPAL